MKLYHGTDIISAHAILRDGINILAGKEDAAMSAV